MERIMAQQVLLPRDALFLGLDSSTQSLKATALDLELRVFASETVHFDTELPHYVTKDGVHRGPGGKVTAPTLMWVEALELLFDKLEKDNFPFQRVKGISGSGQQHGSIYWRIGALGSALQNLARSEKLVVQLKDAFSTVDSPIWMDSSTTKQCRAIEEAVGGAASLADITGSRAYERFTGPQIRKLFEDHQQIYENTERISLVSSFMASILVGDYVSIDYSDGAGMNLMDFQKRVWSKTALDATAPDLENKLGKLAPSHEVAGNLSPFFVERYNFSQDCVVIHWSGDNPNSLAEGRAGFYYREPEILPPLPAGVHRFQLRSFLDSLEQECSLETNEVQEFEPAVEVRALVEGQFLSMRAHCERRGMPSPPERVIATGGASANIQLLRTIGDIFGCAVYTAERPDSASLGAALRAAHGWVCQNQGEFVPISELYKGREEGSAVQCKLVAERGSEKLHKMYGVAARKRMELESKLLRKFCSV